MDNVICFYTFRWNNRTYSDTNTGYIDLHILSFSLSLGLNNFREFRRSNKKKHFKARKHIRLRTYVRFCAIWYHLYNFKNVKNTPGGVLHLVKLQAQVCKPATLLKVTLLHLYKWYQITQSVSYILQRYSQDHFKHLR